MAIQRCDFVMSVSSTEADLPVDCGAEESAEGLPLVEKVGVAGICMAAAAAKPPGGGVSPTGGLLRAMMVTGSSNVVRVLLAIVRVKVLAVLLGPSGVGLLGIYNSLVTTVSTIADLGLASSGVRSIAAAQGAPETLARVRRVLLLAGALQGVVGMVFVWALRVPLARWLTGSEAYAAPVGLMGIAVALTLIGGAQSALLRGLRKLGDLARTSIAGAALCTATGLWAVWYLGDSGLVWFVLVQPASTFVVATYYVRRLPKPEASISTAKLFWEAWRPMAKLGAVFMLAGLGSTATLLWTRSYITHALGLEQAGLFAAVWGITIQYIGILLTAMAGDYYPRLSEVMGDSKVMSALVNAQAQLALALGGPVLLLMFGLAPWLLHLLYSAEFADAAVVLQLQTVGNLFKLASWPLSFVLVAAARSRTFLLLELSWNAAFAGLLQLLLPLYGLTAAGMAFLGAYVLYFFLAHIGARHTIGFRYSLWCRRIVYVQLIAGALAVPLFLLERSGQVWGCVILAGLVASFSVRAYLSDPNARALARSRLARARLIRK